MNNRISRYCTAFLRSLQRRPASVCWLFGFAILCHPTLFASEGEQPLQLLAVKENALRLRQGDYYASGYYVIDWYDPKTGADRGVSTYDVAIEGAFDNDRENTSFFQTRSLKKGGESARFGNWSKSWAILTPEYWLSGQLLSPDRPVKLTFKSPISLSSVPERLEPVFDVRSMSFRSLIGLHTPFDQAFQAIESMDFKASNEVEQGIAKLTRVDTSVGNTISIWLDQAYGYQPVKYSIAREGEEAFTASETSWEKNNGVWVIKTFDIYQKYPDRKDNLRLAFRWKSVNEPIPESRFDWHDFDLPKNSMILDARANEKMPTVIEAVGNPPEVRFGRERHEDKRIMWLVILVNVIIIGLLTGAIVRRRLSARQR
jgi:hypothetical protein